MGKLRRIFGDPAFKGVWEALSEYIRTSGCYLIIVLGNHDVELSFPDVQHAVREQLAGADSGAAGRLLFATDGSGYFCRVGSSNVLCLHGNEVDPWNPVDYQSLGEVIQAKKRLRKPPRWTPNAGTKMVIEVMNDIKEQKRWVDLLKPEKESVLPLVFALEPDSIRKLTRLPGIAARRFGFLGDEDAPREEGGLAREEAMALDKEGPDKGEWLGKLLGETFGVEAPARGQSLDVEHFLAQAEEAMEEGVDPMSLAEEGVLGIGGAIIDRIRGRSPEENMREALLKWSDPRIFSPFHKDEAFHEIDRLVGEDVDFVVAGHTHLHRRLSRENGNGVYFNSGSWIRLVKIDEAIMKNKDDFHEVWEVLDKGTIEAMERYGEKPGNSPLIQTIRTVVCISENDDGTTTGALCGVEGQGPRNFTLKEVSGN